VLKQEITLILESDKLEEDGNVNMKDILLKIFGGSAGEVTNRISNVVDKFVRTKDEKAAFEKEMTQILIEAEAAMQKNVTERWKADMASDNKLSKSVRPLVLIFVIVCTMLLIFIDSGFINFAVETYFRCFSLQLWLHTSEEGLTKKVNRLKSKLNGKNKYL